MGLIFRQSLGTQGGFSSVYRPPGWIIGSRLDKVPSKHRCRISYQRKLTRCFGSACDTAWVVEMKQRKYVQRQSDAFTHAYTAVLYIQNGCTLTITHNDCFIDFANHTETVTPLLLWRCFWRKFSAVHMKGSLVWPLRIIPWIYSAFCTEFQLIVSCLVVVPSQCSHSVMFGHSRNQTSDKHSQRLSGSWEVGGEQNRAKCEWMLDFSSPSGWKHNFKWKIMLRCNCWMCQ